MSESLRGAKLGRIARLLTLASLLLLGVIYVTPTWWVALKAPNYPAEAFPDGVRIHFHMNGVFNGCVLQEKTEIYEAEALDCVHEMDAINHFVGMYPIASGGVLEKAFSQFLMVLMGLLLIGFMIHSPRVRLAVMGGGFAVLAAWMAWTFYGSGGAGAQNPGYLKAMVTSLGQGHEEEGEPQSPIIAQLQRSLQESGQTSQVSAADVEESVSRAGHVDLKDALAKLHSGSGAAQTPRSLKEILAEAEKGDESSFLEVLRAAFKADQARLPADQRQEWDGSGWQLLFWHYDKSLGRWFNNPEEIGPLVATMKTAGTVVFWGILALMAFMLFAARRNGGLFYWLLVLVPAVLPLAFLVEYSGWLWWYGHSLNDMGAFTLKPFMPTVFGQGKVAQFTTLSYPHIGFGLMVVSSLCLLLAFLLRRKQLRLLGQEDAA